MGVSYVIEEREHCITGSYNGSLWAELHGLITGGIEGNRLLITGSMLSTLSLCEACNVILQITRVFATYFVFGDDIPVRVLSGDDPLAAAFILRWVD